MTPFTPPFTILVFLILKLVRRGYNSLFPSPFLKREKSDVIYGRNETNARKVRGVSLWSSNVPRLERDAWLLLKWLKAGNK